MRKTLVPIALILTLVASLPAAAALVGSASGVVKDTSGVPLPGVSVTISGPVLQGTRTAVSRDDGSFKFFSLPPGAGYKLVFQLSGFATVESEKFSVQMNIDSQVNAMMRLETVQSEIVVSAEAPVVDVTQTTNQQNFSSEYLKKIPIGSANRSYQSIPQQSAGVVGGGNPNVMGGNLLENSFTVDGVNTTDPVTHTFSFNLNFDAIQEVSLQKSGYEAEYGRASGGVINVVTKGGTNEFGGTFDIRYDNNKFMQNGEYYVDPDGKTVRKHDNSLSKSRNTPWSVTFGGPILKDQLWFFLNTQHLDNYTTPYTGTTIIRNQVPEPAVRRFDGWNSGGKLTFTAIPELSGFFALNDSFAEIPGSSNSAAVRPEATSTQEQKTRLYSLTLNGVITSSWMADLGLGLHRQFLASGPSSGNDAVSGWTNRTEGNVLYDNWTNHQEGDRNRDLGNISTTYFLSNFLGSHQIKSGLDMDRTVFPSFNFTTGTPSDPSFCPGTSGRVCGATFTFNGFDAAGNRIPYRQTVVERLPARETSARSYAFFVQDQWRPFSRLTFNVGVRWDEVKYYDNNAQNFMNMVKWQPRLAGAFDLFGDGKTALRANYGHFYVDAALTFNRLFQSNYITGISRTYQWSTTQLKWNLINQTGGIQVTAALVDGKLKPTYDEQVSFAIEREITTGIKASASYIYKNTKDIFEDTCIDQVTCPDFWVSNQPGRDLGITDALKKNYYAYSFEVQYLKGRVFASGNYVYSKSRGSTDAGATQYAGDDFDWSPDNFVNRYGYLGDDARHRFKLYGNYRIPFVETDLGVTYNYRSGLPYNVTRTSPDGWGAIFDVPRGTDRTTPMHALDLELRKGIPVTDRLQVAVIASALNVTNSEKPTSYGGSVASTKTLRQPLTYQRPRSFQVGFRLDWGN